MTAATPRPGRIKTACLAGLATFLTLIILYGLNDVLDQSHRDRADHGTAIQVVRTTKPPPAPHVEARPRKALNKAPPPPRAPLPTIAGALASESFGIDHLDWLQGGDLNTATLADIKNLTMTADTVDVKPRVRQRGEFRYPSWARKQGLQGHVVINMLINQQGQIETSQILESEPSGIFDETALAMIRQWQFDPAQYQGKNVRVWTKQMVRFDLGENP